MFLWSLGTALMIMVTAVHLFKGDFDMAKLTFSVALLGPIGFLMVAACLVEDHIGDQ